MSGARPKQSTARRGPPAAVFPPARGGVAAGKGWNMSSRAGDGHARCSGTEARPRVEDSQRAAASGGARWRAVFPAMMAHKLKGKEVGEME